MKIKQLIQELKQIEEEHGNLEVKTALHWTLIEPKIELEDDKLLL